MPQPFIVSEIRYQSERLFDEKQPEVIRMLNWYEFTEWLHSNGIKPELKLQNEYCKLLRIITQN